MDAFDILYAICSLYFMQFFQGSLQYILGISFSGVFNIFFAIRSGKSSVYFMDFFQWCFQYILCNSFTNHFSIFYAFLPGMFLVYFMQMFEIPSMYFVQFVQ